jgi:hypothetical protein
MTMTFGFLSMYDFTIFFTVHVPCIYQSVIFNTYSYTWVGKAVSIRLPQTIAVLVYMMAALPKAVCTVESR